MKSSEEIREYLVKTDCTALKGTDPMKASAKDHSYVWNPQNGLLVDDKKYQDFLEDDLAESFIADAGHLVEGSRAFPLNEGVDLFVSQDGVVSYRIQEKTIWSREESLASIVAVDIVQLPPHMQDKFGVKKTILLVTEFGKIFGLDTLTGEVRWQLFDKEFASTDDLALVLANHMDKLTAVVIHPKGLIMHIDPSNGELLEKKKLSAHVVQLSPLGLNRGVIILDKLNNVHIYPDSQKEFVHDNLNNYFMVVVERKPILRLVGYKFVEQDNIIRPQEIWSLSLNESEKLVAVNFKRIDEEVHSPARVLGNRGILYKYVNPNVIAIMTESSVGDPCTPEQSMNVYLVDGVTGALVHHIHHPKARGPSKMVHSENWLVYTYYNIKARRTEVSTLEMFEGVNQVNSTAFSSLTRSHIKPKLIEHKTFIFPSGINAMVDTTTLRGMTNKHLIVSLPSGSLLEIPKIFLDPRRPINMMPEHREEGLVPYMPELPIPSESILNYHQTLLSVKGLVTSPAMYESTSLVFSYGLDLFFTRVTPSKTFDILKDDFDHVLISLVLVFLVVASIVTKYLAQRKALHAAWK